jgi:hypothetical protein
MTNQDPTKNEILEAVAGVKENTEQILEAIGIFSNNMDSRLNTVEKELGEVKASMVTKDHLDEKLSDLRGDLSILIRKEDKKLAELVKILEQRKVLSPEDVKHILALEPFAQS